VVFVLFCIAVVSACSNAVNRIGGLDGLAAGDRRRMHGVIEIVNHLLHSTSRA
jgi:UDP-N-acetylmuramyl pentapeptide phosphotransferase/UDP-N-acetylglucosamine-1-phosphate transferase